MGDGLLTAIYIISIMVRTGKPLSTLLDGFVRIPQKIVNIKVLNKLPLEDISPIQKILKQKENLLKDRGRVVLRYSGTENKARIMVESEDEDLCNNCVKDIAEVVERELERHDST